MDPSLFTNFEFGRPARRPGDPYAFWYFQPEPVPRTIELPPATISALSRADAALGELNGLGQLISEPELLIGPYVTREALASSRIEGTQASLSDVLQVDLEPGRRSARSDDIAEVSAYVRATYRGLELVDSLPLTQRLILEVHRTLLTGVRGSDRLPGELRRSPVWVGGGADKPETAKFVPPLPEFLGGLLADWERYVNEPSDVPVLLRAALMHYQFETIHPFLDGNGRIGRLLVGLFLQREGRLGTPLLYLSGYLEAHRAEYYERLQAVRERGAVQEWLQFFLAAVHQQAVDGVQRARALIALRETYISEASKSRSRIGEILPLIFSNPFLTVKRVEQALGVTNQGARMLIKDIERRGWISPIGASSRGQRQFWEATAIFEVIEAPARYTRGQ